MKTEIFEKKYNNSERKTDILRNIIMSVFIYFIVTVVLFLLYDYHAYAADYTLNDLSLDWSRVSVSKDSTTGTIDFEYPVLTSSGVDGYTFHYIYVPLETEIQLNTGDTITLTQNTNSKSSVNLATTNGTSISYLRIFADGTAGTYTFTTNKRVVGVRFQVYWTNNNTHTFNLENNFGEQFNTDTIPKVSYVNIPVDYAVKVDISKLSELTILGTGIDAKNLGGRPLWASNFYSKFCYTISSDTLSSYNLMNSITDLSKQIQFETTTRNLLGVPLTVSFHKIFTFDSNDKYLYIVYPRYAASGASVTSDTPNKGLIKVVFNTPVSLQLVNIHYLDGTTDVNQDIGTNDTPVIYDTDRDEWVDTGSTDENGNYTTFDTNHYREVTDSGVTEDLENFIENTSNKITDLLKKPVNAVQNMIGAGSEFITELSGIWSWLPSSIVSLITSCLTITLVIGLIKVFL